MNYFLLKVECCSELSSVLIIPPTLGVYLTPKVKRILLNYKKAAVVLTSLVGNWEYYLVGVCNFSQKHLKREKVSSSLVSNRSDHLGVFQYHLHAPSPSSALDDSVFLEHLYTIFVPSISSWNVTFPTCSLTSKFPFNLNKTNQKSSLLRRHLSYPMARIFPSTFCSRKAL